MDPPVRTHHHAIVSRALTAPALRALERRSRGHTRDAVKRGWLTRFIDTFTPF